MTDTAKEVFHIGQRVKLTLKGLNSLGYEGNATKVKHDDKLRGTVRGFGRADYLVRVQRDGIKTIDTYSMDFWEAE